MVERATTGGIGGRASVCRIKLKHYRLVRFVTREVGWYDGTMRWARLTGTGLLLGLILSDIASPLSPGAFQFALERSIEVAQHGTPRTVGATVQPGRPQPAMPSTLPAGPLEKPTRSADNLRREMHRHHVFLPARGSTA